MAAGQLYSGTKVLGATEWSCSTDTAGPDADTTAGTYQLVLDLADMVAGDELQVRCYEKCRSGDTQRQLWDTVLVGAQSNPLWGSPAFVLLHGWDFTITANSGTITVNWSIRHA